MKTVFFSLLSLLLFASPAQAISPFSKVLYSDTNISASEDGSTFCFSREDAEEVVDLSFTLDADHNGGTSPTLDVTIEESEEGTSSDIWYDVGNFTQVTTSNSDQRMRLTYNGVARCLRASLVLGGTSPDYDVTVKIWFNRK